MSGARHLFAFDDHRANLPAGLGRGPRTVRSPIGPWVPLCLVSLAACAGGTRAGTPNDGTTATGGPSGGCEAISSTEIDAGAMTSLGFSANEVLAFVEGTHEEELTWQAQAGFDYGPESGDHRLTLTLAHTGAPRLTSYAPTEGDITGDRDCGDAIELDMKVTLTTDEGALQETFETTLAARSDLTVSLAQTFDAERLTGAFAASNVAEGYTLLPLVLSAHLTQYGTRGSLRAALRHGGANGVGSDTVSPEPLLSWGPQHCGSEEIAVPHSAVVNGFSSEEVLDLLNAAPTAVLSYEDGTVAAASLSFSALGERACAAVARAHPADGGAGALYLAGFMNLKARGARVDATWPVAMSVAPDRNGSIAHVHLALDNERLAGQGSFAERYGIEGVDVSGVDSARAFLDLVATPSAPLQGRLEVTGFHGAPCSAAATCDVASPVKLARIDIAASR